MTPDRSNPIEYVPFFCDLTVLNGIIGIVVIPDASVRSILLRREAGKVGGVYWTFDETTPPSRFIRAIASAAGLELVGRASFRKVYQLVVDWLIESRTPLFVEGADHLTMSCLRVVAEFVDLAESREVRCGVVLCSADPGWASRIQGGAGEHFLSRCAWYVNQEIPKKDVERLPSGLRLKAFRRPLEPA